MRIVFWKSSTFTFSRQVECEWATVPLSFRMFILKHGDSCVPTDLAPRWVIFVGSFHDTDGDRSFRKLSESTSANVLSTQSAQADNIRFDPGWAKTYYTFTKAKIALALDLECITQVEPSFSGRRADECRHRASYSEVDLAGCCPVEFFTADRCAISLPLASPALTARALRRRGNRCPPRTPSTTAWRSRGHCGGCLRGRSCRACRPACDGGRNSPCRPAASGRRGRPR